MLPIALCISGGIHVAKEKGYRVSFCSDCKEAEMTSRFGTSIQVFGLTFLLSPFASWQACCKGV